MRALDAEDRWLADLDLQTVQKLLHDNGAGEMLYKILPANANSKNQVYLARDFSQLGKIPSDEVTLHESTSAKRGGAEAVFRAALEFFWVNRGGRAFRAPDAKLIFYPQYPEVRFSGFLKNCDAAPSSLYDKSKRGSEPDRVLVLGVGTGRKVFGITLPPESPAAIRIRALPREADEGVLFPLPWKDEVQTTGFESLMQRLCEIHRRSWVDSMRLAPDGRAVPCNASNCVGNTLEALLGIRSNGFSQPDFMGWEIKARSVSDCERPGSSVVTLFTPEPTGGMYVDEGVETFLRRHGYLDTKGRSGRRNFGGIYRAGGAPHARTGLRLVVEGFDPERGVCAPGGAVRMLDARGTEAMAWSFTKLIDHWKVKHAHAAFVPAEGRNEPDRQYRYGRRVLLGEGAEFRLLLAALHAGIVYYDPGIKQEFDGAGRTRIKRRSQFRVSSGNLPVLYASSRVVDVCEAAGCAHVSRAGS